MPRPYFYKLVLNSTIQERRLRIPDNFLKKFKDEIAQVVTLHIPDGHIWRVGVRKVENKYWLHDGWQDFVGHYSIGLGYFLVFRYEGNSVFNVYIYNLTNSEINYHPSARSTAGEHFQSRQYHVFKDMEDEDLADVFGSSSPRQTPESFKKKAANASADQLSLNRGFNPTALQNLFNGNMNPPGKSDVSSQQGIRPPEQVSPFSGAVKVKSDGDEVRVQPLAGTASKPKKASRKKRKTEAIAGEPLTAIPPDASSEMRFRFYASASSRKRTVTAEERERAVNSAKMFEPPNPFCRVVLRPSYLYRGCIMYLPSCFAEKNLNGVSGFIKLQRADGKQWSVRCLYKGGRAKLSQGWYDFTLENNLEEGDVCVFELLSAREEVTLKVTTFRVVDDVALLTQPQQQQQQHHPR